MSAPHRPVDAQQSFPALEQAVLARWSADDVFHETVRRRKGRPPWIFYEGPPTANGRPGTHHVLARIFKDIFPRYKTMCGLLRRAQGRLGLPRPAGRAGGRGGARLHSKDDIERYGIAEFNAKCRESVFRYVEEWARLTERIGYWVDLEDAYRTLDDSYIESVWWALRTIWDKGLLYEGHKVVPYCPRCGTALSSHELGQPGAYQDVIDPSASRAPPGDAAGRPAAGRRRAAGLDDDAVDAAVERGGRGRPRPHVRARAHRRRGGLRARGGAGRARARQSGRSTCSTASPAARSSVPPTSRRSRSSPARPTARRGTRSCRPTSSRPTTAPGSSTPRSRSARTTSASASSRA